MEDINYIEELYIVKDLEANLYYNQNGDWSDSISYNIKLYDSEQNAKLAIIQRSLKWQSHRYIDENGEVKYFPKWSKCTEDQKNILMSKYQIIPITFSLKN